MNGSGRITTGGAIDRRRGRGGGRRLGRATLALLACLTIFTLAPVPPTWAQGEGQNAKPAPTATGAGAAADGSAGGAGAEVEMGGGVPTVGQLFMTSPIINGAILLLSLIAVGVFAYLMLSVTTASFSPPQLVDDVTRAVLDGQFDQAVHICRSRPQPFASSVIQRVVENRDKDPGVLMSILEAEGTRRAERLWNRVGYLAEVATIAPTLGLLGTVIGMIKVFFELNVRIVGTGQVGDLSEGIAQAMGTTMFGLIVALIAGVFYTLVKARATDVLTATEQVCQTIADHTHRAAKGGTAGGGSTTGTIWGLAPTEGDGGES